MKQLMVGMATIVLLSVGAAQGAVQIYWTDNMGSVLRANADGSGLQIVVSGSQTVGYDVQDIEIDTRTSQLYQYGILRDGTTGLAGAGQGFLRRSNLDGSSPETLILGDILPNKVLWGFAIDFENDEVYMGGHGSGGDPDVGGIRRSNLDGTELESILPNAGNTHGIAVDNRNNKVLYTQAFAEEGVWRANSDGSSNERIMSGDGSSGWLAFDPTSNRLFHSQYYNNRIVTANADGTGMTTLISTPSPSALDLDLAAGEIYWGDASDIWRANIDGSGVEKLFAMPNPDWIVEDLEVYDTAAVPEASSFFIWSGLTACAFGYGRWRKRRPV
jgi:hypothetical protein